MKTRSLFYCVVAVIVLVAVLLQSVGIFARSARAQGPITFIEHTIAGDFDGAQSVYATDVDGDGDVDILSAGGNSIAWWENDGSQNFTQRTITDDFDGACSVYATDVDDDGDVDVLGAAYLAGGITWWENDGSENFAGHTVAGNFGGVRSVYATDVDDDGDVDILGAGGWWENDGSENFAEHTIANFSGARSVYATDVDDDGDVDVLGAVHWADDITWWENDGNENFAERTIADDFDGACSVYATDVDDDGDVDVLGAGAAWPADDITWWENDGSQNFAQHTITDDFDGARSVYATDVDGDGDVDVLGAAYRADGITWWENDGSQNFAEHIFVGNFSDARSVYATDVDGDGDGDVLGAAYGADDITWWENSEVLYLPLVLKNHTPGTGPTNQPPNPPSNPSPSDGATNQSMDVNMSWTGGDPDGDDVTYDVYFEANDSTPDVLVSNDQSGTSYDLDMLISNTHYYWQIVARDEHGATTAGPVWDFIMEAGLDVAIVFDKSGSMEFDTLCYGCWEYDGSGFNYPDNGTFYPLPYNPDGYGETNGTRPICDPPDYYEEDGYKYTVIEAEYYSYNRSFWDRDYAVRGIAHWILQRNTTAYSWENGYAGYTVGSSGADGRGGYMKVIPFYQSTYEEGATDYGDVDVNTPRLDYDFHTPTSEGGDYYIYLRSQGGRDQSGYDVDPRLVHWGLDGIPQGSETVDNYGIAYDGARSDRWNWNRIGPVSLSGNQDYTLNLWVGGLGFCLDKIIITRDDNCEGSGHACRENSWKGPTQTPGRTSDACDPSDRMYDLNDDLYDDEQSIRAAKESVKRFMDDLDPELDQVSYVHYSSTNSTDTRIASHLYCQKKLGEDCQNFDSVLQAIEDTLSRGSTAMADGMRLGIETLRTDFTADECRYEDKPCGRPEAARIMILMTDGVANDYFSSHYNDARNSYGPAAFDALWPPTSYSSSTEDQAKDYVIYQALQARDNGIVIYTIGLGLGADFALVQEVAEITEGEFFFCNDPTNEVALDYIFDVILSNY